MNIKLLVLRTTVERDVGTNERRQLTGAEQFQHKNSIKFQSRLVQHTREGLKKD